MTGSFPSNFVTLHQGEEFVRSKSVEAIEKSDDLLLHAHAVEHAADLIHFLIHKDEHRSEDDLTIRLLGIRLFNSINASLKLLLSGYYQAAALQIRDLIETFFLLDYLNTDHALIAEWRVANDDDRYKKFRPKKVRDKINSRDALTGDKRGELYKLFSDLAGHPNPAGFQMYRLPDGTHHCGPFFEEKPLVATISELARSAIQAASLFGSFFAPATKPEFSAKLGFMEFQNEWFARFYGKALIPKDEIDAIKTQVGSLAG